ncbi:hypothetical protein P7H14_16450 [Paenibacillus larvae]|nr:hypothetical protein [Paenibacillus larvae]MDT2193436.1 hypothetical protein [Paenibacillus larvae]
MADITYIPTDEGWLYLASLEDLCMSREDRLVSHGRANDQGALPEGVGSGVPPSTAERNRVASFGSR